MKRLFPEHLQTLYEKFLYNHKNDEQTYLFILWDIERDIYEQYFYITPISINNLFYEYIYGDKEGLNNEEKQFIKYFDKILNVQKQLDSLDLLDTNKLIVNNESVIIINPCYVFSKDWNTDWTNLISKYIYHSTLIGDVTTIFFHTKMNSNFHYFNNYNQLGTCTADAGLIGVFYLNDILEYNNEDFNKNYLNTKLVMRIDNFIGIIQIKITFDTIEYKIFFYVEGLENINFIGLVTLF